MSHLYDLAIAFSNKEPPPGNLRSPGQNWAGACGALCSQFEVYVGGWNPAPKGYGPDAETVGDNSGWLNPNAAAAPINAFHFWHVGSAGHNAVDLNGGGTHLFMASTRAGGIDLGNALRIMSVAQYNATGGVTYRGWSTNYWGGVSVYKEPVVNPLPNQRKVKPEAGVKRRAQPIRDDTLYPGINPPIAANTITTPAGWVTGDGYQNQPWYKNADGTYSHSSGFTDQGTHDLVNLNTVTVTFDAVGGGPVPAPQTILVNTPAALPEEPVLAGFTFAGWLDSLGLPWDFATPVATSVTLTAGWTEIPPVGCDCPTVEEIVEAVKLALAPEFTAIHEEHQAILNRPFPTYVPLGETKK